jgi:hypothetical protein
MMMVADIGEMQLQAGDTEDCQQPPEAQRVRHRALERAKPCQRLDFRLSASRTMR